MSQHLESALNARLIRLPGPVAPLRLLCPESVDALLERVDPDSPGAEERIPYWADLWPSADGMVRWLFSGLAPRRPGSALELGCGLGLVGMAALRLGWRIDLGDRDPDAVALAGRNLAANGLDPRRARLVDWRDPPDARYDSILAADILYEQAFAEPLTHFLSAALAPGGRAYLAEPGRPVAGAALAAFAERFRIRQRSLRARVDGCWRVLRLIELRRPELR